MQTVSLVFTYYIICLFVFRMREKNFLHENDLMIWLGFLTTLQVPMTRLRKRVATRLKDSQNTFALLTTFNEVDM